MRQDPTLARSVALVTGAGGSLGRATALRLGADGYGVVVTDHVAGQLSETTRLLQDAGVRTRQVVLDLRDAEAIAAAVDHVESEFGAIEVLVNNAAIYPPTPFLEIPVSEYDDVVAVNQRAYFVVAQAVAQRMVSRGFGAIVNVASITWHGGWANLASYVSTKGAAIALTRALARELGPHGIRVNAVSPGAFPTNAETIYDDPEAYSAHVVEQQSLKRRGTPAELASVISFLAAADAGFVTGQTINVDGGWVME